MKLSKSQLKQIIQEELQNILNEQYVPPGAAERGVAAGLDALKGAGTAVRQQAQRGRTGIKRAADRMADLSPVGDSHYLGSRCVRCSREEQVATRRAQRAWLRFNRNMRDVHPQRAEMYREAVEFAKRELIARGVFTDTGQWPEEINFRGGPFAWADTIKEVIKMASAAPRAAEDAGDFNWDAQ